MTPGFSLVVLSYPAASQLAERGYVNVAGHSYGKRRAYWSREALEVQKSTYRRVPSWMSPQISVYRTTQHLFEAPAPLYSSAFEPPPRYYILEDVKSESLLRTSRSYSLSPIPHLPGAAYADIHSRSMDASRHHQQQCRLYGNVSNSGQLFRHLAVPVA